jgi:[acyl-carrier-protein] S-malonyltransferase
MDNITHLIATVLLQASKELPAVKEMLKQAEAVLGYDLLQLCQEGPKEKLDDTVYSQPALFVAGLAAVEKLRQDNAQAVDNCSATAGKSCCKACMTGLSAAAC